MPPHSHRSTTAHDSAHAKHHGPLDWRRVVEWLSADGVISPDEAQRTIARCSQAESRQNPLVRLANVAMERASDGKPLDVDMLTEYLAQRSGLEYLRIDPLKVDVGKVADTMSATYAERHKVLPVQVTAKEVVVATAEPFITDWVAEVERQSRRTVRRVVANPLDVSRYLMEFYGVTRSVRKAKDQKDGARELGSKVPGRLVVSAKSWLSHAGVDRNAAILPWGAAEDVPRVSPVVASASYLAHVRGAWDAEHPREMAYRFGQKNPCRRRVFGGVESPA